MTYLNKKSLVILLLLFNFIYLVEASSESYIKVNNQLIAKVDNQEIKFYQLDFMKNVRTEFTEDSVNQIVDYLPFGKALNLIASVFGYRSRFVDKDTSLYLNYDPEVGRFIIPVNTVADKFDSQSLNPYSFMKNNPFRQISSEQVVPDLTIPERQDGVEGKSVSGGGTLSQKWEKHAYANKVSYKQVKAIVDAVCAILCWPSEEKQEKQKQEEALPVPHEPIPHEYKPKIEPSVPVKIRDVPVIEQDVPIKSFRQPFIAIPESTGIITTSPSIDFYQGGLSGGAGAGQSYIIIPQTQSLIGYDELNSELLENMPVP